MDTANPDTQDCPPTRVARPRLSVQTRIVLWVVVATALPVALQTAAQHHLRAWSLHSDQAGQALRLNHALAMGLSGRLGDGWSAEAQALVESVAQDDRLALVQVTDVAGAVLYRRPQDATALASLARAGVVLEGLALEVGRPRAVGERGAWTLCRHAVWSTPPPGPERRLTGYVTTATYNPATGAAGLRGDALSWAFAGFSVLVVALAVWLASRQVTRSLRQMLDAAHSLADHHAPPPVPAHTRDEIGLLGGAFNEMAQRLAGAHEELRAHNENLEQLVARRTVELEQANQRLADQIADKDAFLRSVSHDLNAPLRNIDGMASMVLRKHRGTLDDDVVRKLERICANVKQQSELINELVVLNRQRAKPTDANLIDLNQMVGEVFEGLGHEFEQGRIRASIEGTLPTIRAERTRVRQIFQNLIDNAAKYMMDASRRQIVVRCEEELDFYRFSVQDTGRGIAWEDQPKVFRVFQRATHSGTHQVQGKGIGLASVKAIVEGYGGQIWLDSELGKGSTFHFTLAREKVSPPLEPAAAPPD